MPPQQQSFIGSNFGGYTSKFHNLSGYIALLITIISIAWIFISKSKTKRRSSSSSSSSSIRSARNTITDKMDRNKSNSNSNSSGGSANTGNNDKDMEVIVKSAKQLIKQGKTNEAFAVLLHAIKLSRGEDAILEVLDSAKQRHEVDMLSSELDRAQMDEVYEVMNELTERDTLLKEQGNEGILTEAFEDGSSIVCKNCGGLIAKKRWSDHVMYWCSSSDLVDSDDDEDRCDKSGGGSTSGADNFSNRVVRENL
jgi:hypothetical protein